MVERNANGDKSLENWIWDIACSICGTPACRGKSKSGIRFALNLEPQGEHE